jgi:mRNA interferase MazF
MAEPPSELRPGAVLWAWLDPVIGREQGGNRPVVCVSSAAHLGLVDSMFVCVPVTAVDRRWPNHVLLSGSQLSLPRPCRAMTEQLRTLSRERVKATAGQIDAACLTRIRWWIDGFLAR